MLELLRKYFFLIVIIFAGILFLVFSNHTDNSTNDEFSAISMEESPSEEQKQSVNHHAVVDVKGEVDKPGVYEVPLESRIKDVVELAGGFTDNADQSLVNLAQKVQDEMIILIPEKNGDNPETSTGSDSGKVRVNQAAPEEMETLSGIGPAKAQAIIDHREEHGYFQSPEDLLEVSGIGQKTLDNLKDELLIP